MLLQRLEIFRGEHVWSTDPDAPLNGTVKFVNKQGDEIKLRIGTGASQRIMAIVADELVNASKAIACDLTAEILNSTQPQLTGPASGLLDNPPIVLREDPPPGGIKYTDGDDLPF